MAFISAILWQKQWIIDKSKSVFTWGWNLWPLQWAQLFFWCETAQRHYNWWENHWRVWSPRRTWRLDECPYPDRWGHWPGRVGLKGWTGPTPLYDLPTNWTCPIWHMHRRSCSPAVFVPIMLQNWALRGHLLHSSISSPFRLFLTRSGNSNLNWQRCCYNFSWYLLLLGLGWKWDLFWNFGIPVMIVFTSYIRQQWINPFKRISSAVLRFLKKKISTVAL